MASKDQRALFLDSKQGKFVVANHVVPRPGPGEILIKVKASGLNPIEWKIQKYGIFVQDYPIVLGVNIAGDVIEVGEISSRFSPGDRVVAHGVFSNTGGGFQQYALGIAAFASKLPHSVSYDQGATISSSLGAAYLALYQQKPHGLGFTSPTKDTGRGKYSDTPLMIFGGATAVGQYTIQLAKLSGFSPIITTSSLVHQNFLRDLGADKVIDRYASLQDLRDQLTSTTSLPVEYVLDAVSVPQTQQMANDILAPGGHLQLVQNPDALFSPDKNVGFTKGLRSLPENRVVLEELYSHLTDLLEQGLVKTCPVEVLPGGLNGIPVGLERLEKDQVSGLKLVVHPDETH